MPKQMKTSQQHGVMNNRKSEKWWHSEFKEAYPMKACNRCHAVYYDQHWHHEPALYEKVAGTQMVRNIRSRASNRDPQDQIIKIEDKGDTIRITTTENQLAVSLAKQVARAHKGGKLDIKFSKE